MTFIPKRPSPPTGKPAIDNIVVAYLAEVHDINVQPVTSIAPSRGTNALMGAMGPDVLVANTLMTQQSKAAAQQEWLHMKTFALQQPDFAEYKAKAMEAYNDEFKSYELELKRYELNMQQPEIVAALKQREETADKHTKSANILFVCLTTVLISLFQVYFWQLDTSRKYEKPSLTSSPK